MSSHYDKVNGARSLDFLLKRFSRRGAIVLALAAALVTTMVVTSLQAPASQAAEASGVTWTPGDVDWQILDDGRCLTSQVVDVNTQSHDDAVAMSTVLQGIPAKTDFPADSGIQDVHMNVGMSVNTTNFPVTMHSYLAADKCKAANVAQQTLYGTTGGGKLDTVKLEGAPGWLKGAIGALVGAAVYVAVSAMVTAGIAATGVLVGASAATIAGVTALSGCVGGSSSMAMTLLLAGAGAGWQANLSNAVAGCITGAVIGLLPIKQVGDAAGNAIRGALGLAPLATVGEAGVAAASSAGVELAGITEVVGTAADAAIAVR